ncbi:MAG: GIY-YIG nuclease family protein [Patescibacteria group bacterium]
MLYYVYILQSLRDKRFYIGFTSDLIKRLEYHNSGKNKSTKYRAPFIMVYSEEYGEKLDACKREYYLKSPKGFLEKKSIIEKLFDSRVAQR